MFSDVKVPKENRIGEDGFGFKFAMSVLNGGRIGIAARGQHEHLTLRTGAHRLVEELGEVWSLDELATVNQVMRQTSISGGWRPAP